MNKKSKVVSYNKWGYIFLIPFTVIFLIFQLVPLATTIYNSIFENEKTKIFNIELLAGCKNILEEFDSKYEKLGEIIHIYDVSDKGFMLCNDMRKERIICFKK